MNEILFNKINELRLIKKQISFLQIGAYDGISMNDIANVVLNENDRGIFIEPNPYILSELKKNKSNFINSKILSYAVLPDNDFYHDFFHVHKNGGGSSFIRGMFNNEIPESENYEVVNIQTITVEELFKQHIDFEIDIVFTDCEGYDFDINKKILEVHKPKIIYMEAWNTIDLNTKSKQKITTRDEMIQHLKNNGYKTIFENIGENLTCFLS